MSNISRSIYDRIQVELSRKGITATKMLRDCLINTSFMTDLKNKKTSPSIDKILMISEYLGVSLDYLVLGVENLPPTLRGDEKRLLRLYNELNDSGRRLSMVSMYKAVKKNKEDREWWETHREAAEKLLLETFGDNAGQRNTEVIATVSNSDDSWIYEEDDFERDETPYPITRNLPCYAIPASAGTGTFLDSSDYTALEVPFDKAPIQANFCVNVDGNSMEPDYQDKDILFVKQQPTLEDGDLGVFMLNGEAFFKKLYSKGKSTKLLSLNSEYSPIEIKAVDELRVIGKVLGKYTQ